MHLPAPTGALSQALGEGSMQARTHMAGGAYKGVLPGAYIGGYGGYTLSYTHNLLSYAYIPMHISHAYIPIDISYAYPMHILFACIYLMH